MAMNQNDWLEYFETVNGRKPTVEEFATAKMSGEFGAGSSAQTEKVISTQPQNYRVSSASQSGKMSTARLLVLIGLIANTITSIWAIMDDLMAFGPFSNIDSNLTVIANNLAGNSDVIGNETVGTILYNVGQMFNKFPIQSLMTDIVNGVIWVSFGWIAFKMMDTIKEKEWKILILILGIVSCISSFVGFFLFASDIESILNNIVNIAGGIVWIVAFFVKSKQSELK